MKTYYLVSKVKAVEVTEENYNQLALTFRWNTNEPYMMIGRWYVPELRQFVDAQDLREADD